MLGTHPIFGNYFFASLWNNYIRDNTPPLVIDIIESIIEAIEVVLDYIIQVLRFILPHVASTIQICALLFGKLFRLIKHLGAGRGLRGCLAEDAGVDVGSPFSVIKALRDSVLNSPYVKGKLPFSGFVNPFSQSPHVDDVRVESIGNSSSSSSSSTPRVTMASSTLGSGTSAVTSTERTPSGVLRSGGQKKRATPTDLTPPSLSSSSGNKNTRRVLFTTTESGDVHTERFRYDKELPASARKAPPPSPTAKRGVTDGSSADNRIERVEEVALSQGEKAVVAASSELMQSPSSVPMSSSNQNMPSKASVGMRNDKDITTDEEMRKQEYIQKYGLLPSITPLSKRYGRMKRQQQQTLVSSIDTAAAATTNMNKPVNNNRKRRGDLLGVASRLGRDRRARLTTQSTFLFDRRRTPKRGREEETRANEWVWRAMNNIGGGEKENNANGEPGSVAKRGKFDNNTGGSSGNDRSFVVGTPPPKNAIANPAVDRVLTPPNTPFPTKARINAPATPAIRKTNINDDDDDESAKITFALGSAVKDFADATPVKPSNDTTSDGGISKTGFSFTTATTTSVTASTAAAVTNFSFDTATRAKVDDGKVVGGAFAFGKSTDAANNVTNTPLSSAKFAFGENQAGGISTAKKVMFGSTPQPTSTRIADKSSNPSLFSFDMAKTSETTTPTVSGAVTAASTSYSFGVAQTTAPASSSSGAGFSFGAGPTTSSLAAAPTPAPYSFLSISPVPNNKHGVSLSFGTGATSPIPDHGATGIQPSSTGFAFGSTQLAGSATTAQSSTFSFGTATATGGTPSVLAVPNFGVAPTTNSFNPVQGGAASSGASSRRRAAKQIGRKK
jgi:hypothetical protein